MIRSSYTKEFKQYALGKVYQRKARMQRSQ